MKKIIFNCFTGFILTWTVAGYSQNSNITAKINTNSSLEKTIVSSDQLGIKATENSTSVSINEINTKAVRNFDKEFKNATAVKWIKTSNGLFAAHFVSDGIQNLVCYNKKGNYQCMLRYYKEEKLPSEVRHLVKSSYYDFDIYLVTEVDINGKVAYVVKMEDKTSWKTIKVVDGEMETMEEYIKSK